jgi:hypothetical protein
LPFLCLLLRSQRSATDYASFTFVQVRPRSCCNCCKERREGASVRRGNKRPEQGKERRGPKRSSVASGRMERGASLLVTGIRRERSCRTRSRARCRLDAEAGKGRRTDLALFSFVRLPLLSLQARKGSSRSLPPLVCSIVTTVADRAVRLLLPVHPFALRSFLCTLPSRQPNLLLPSRTSPFSASCCVSLVTLHRHQHHLDE